MTNNQAILKVLVNVVEDLLPVGKSGWDFEAISRRLRLPEGSKIRRACQLETWPTVVVFLVEHPDFPPIRTGPDGDDPPEVRVEYGCDQPKWVWADSMKSSLTPVVCPQTRKVNGMKIIRPGKLPVKQCRVYTKHTGTCTLCGCKVECDERDFLPKLGKTVKCPTEGCGRDINVTPLTGQGIFTYPPSWFNKKYGRF